MSGCLFLVPNTLDFGVVSPDGPSDLQEVLPLGVIRIAARLEHWVAEDARTTRAFLKRVNAVVPLACALQDIRIAELPRPPKGGRTNAPADWQALLAPAHDGHELGLISEAGLPAIADPGAALVQLAHTTGLSVLPLAGPSSLLLALAASGLNGQSFAFVGYLPVDAVQRSTRIRALEALSRQVAQTQLMIETPYRNDALLAALIASLNVGTRLSVSCGLTLAGGWTRTDTVQGWRSKPVAMPKDVPAVFSLLAA